MFNPTEIPSLSPILDKVIEEVKVVPGIVDKLEGHFYLTFSIPTDDLGKMTGKEVFLLYLKPAVEAMGKAIVEYAGASPVCTKAIHLPPKGSPVIGWRCFKGRVPVNVYVARRMEPDRHQFIVESIVQKVEQCNDESSCN